MKQDDNTGPEVHASEPHYSLAHYQMLFACCIGQGISTGISQLHSAKYTIGFSHSIRFIKTESNIFIHYKINEDNT